MKRKLIFLTLCWVIALQAFSYHAPLGTKIGTFSNTFDKAYLLQPGSLGTIPSGSNCFAFVLQMDLQSREYGNIFSLRNKNTDVTLLSVDFNSQGRVVVTRPFGKGRISYEIYDRLLTIPATGSARHEFRIFLCGSFIWMEVTVGSQVSVTPLFWGINRPEVYMIDRIVHKDGAYEFVFGGLNNIASTLVHGNLEVYASTYSGLRNDIISHFLPTQLQTRVAQPEIASEPSRVEISDDVRVYPTFVEQELHVDLTLKQPGDVTYEIYGLQGALCFKSSAFYSAPGQYREVFSKSRMASAKGMAILLIRMPDKTVTKKILFR